MSYDLEKQKAITIQPREIDADIMTVQSVLVDELKTNLLSPKNALNPVLINPSGNTEIANLKTNSILPINALNPINMGSGIVETGTLNTTNINSTLDTTVQLKTNLINPDVPGDGIRINPSASSYLEFFGNANYYMDSTTFSCKSIGIPSGSGLSNLGNTTLGSQTIVSLCSARSDYTQLGTATTQVPVTSNSGTITTVVLTNTTGVSITFNVAVPYCGGYPSNFMLVKLISYSGTWVTQGIPIVVAGTPVGGDCPVTIINTGLNQLNGTVTFFYQII